MALQRIDHVSVVVDDLAASIGFFVVLGFVLAGETPVDGEWVDRIVGLQGVRADIAMMETPDGHGRVELVKFHSPPARGGDRQAPANTLGLRHLACTVDDLDATLEKLRAVGAQLIGEVETYKDVYRLCYVRGPEGIIVELAERLA